MSVSVTTRKGSVIVAQSEDLDQVLVETDSPVTQVDINNGLPMPFPVPGPEGDQGDPGPQGPQGDPGPPGSSAAASYTHTQGVAASTWNVAHNLGFYPNVSIVDSSNREVIGDVEYVDTNNLILTFSAAFSGKAYVS